MGQIVAGYDLMPESTDVDLNGVIAKLSEILPEGVKITETSIQPVAFGLMKVNAGFVIDDSDEEAGGKLEAALLGIEGIETIECVASTVL
ncbi:MAG: elongation factor 1-beta [Candidatus Methanomethylophilaceae archaeon]|nr:elongation factor 1-beta [Candidatus Methanomethylophilaceae archaeon]